MDIKILRRSYSLFRMLRLSTNSYIKKIICNWFIDGVSFSGRVFFHGDSIISCTDLGLIKFGNNVNIHKNVRIVSKGGSISIGENVFIGQGVIIVANENIVIGDDSMISEYCVIRDQNHSYKTRPIRKAGFETAPIFIGSDVWIGAKATVLKGSRIEDGAIIGAHSLVNGKIDAKTLAVGSPAKVIKSL